MSQDCGGGGEPFEVYHRRQEQLQVGKEMNYPRYISSICSSTREEGKESEERVLHVKGGGGQRVEMKKGEGKKRGGGAEKM